MHCPYSGTLFTLSRIITGDETDIQYGIVTSEYGEFPIVAGILRLLIDEYRQVIVSMLADGDTRRALLTALDQFPFQGKRVAIVNFASKMAYRHRFSAVGRLLAELKRPVERVYEDESVTFVQSQRQLGPASRASWQISRFSMPRFLSTYALIHLVKGATGVLDFGCGTGQSAFLISRIAKDARITCADYSFSSLYLAKKYFARQAQCVCMNGDYPLPFASGEFSTVLSSDALHLIDSKLSLAGEFKRVLAAKGTIVMPHLHSKLSGFKSGKPLTPMGYSELFKDLEHRVIPEDAIVRGYLCQDELDIEREWTSAELGDAKTGVSIVASDDAAVFRKYSDLWENYIKCMKNPTVNPIYRIHDDNGEWHLKRDVSDFYAKTVECNGVEYIPDEIKLKLPSLDRDALRTMMIDDNAVFCELVRKFVVIDVPDQFL
jgi:SAM-dependent methyltransferase